MSLSNPFLQAQRAEFLRHSGWVGANEVPLHADWSQRKFFRIVKGDKTGDKTAMLMQSVPDDDPRMTPGHRLRDFVRISAYLHSIGLSAPLVLAQDPPHGLLLVEDFGSDDFISLFEKNRAMERDLYILATAALKHIYRMTEFVPIDLPDYFSSHIHKGHQRVVDWYMPAMLKHKNDDGVVSEYLNVWKGIEQKLPQPTRRLLHGDYHPGNLMWLPIRQDYKQVGLIDFQQAMMGPAPYDLVNLLEDARREVPMDIRDECLDIYCADMGAAEKESFLAWYPVLSAQFHCRVIGQAIRLAIKDNKTRLLSIIPVLRRHMIRDLKNPILLPLKEWFFLQGVDFSDTSEIDVQKIAQFIRPDAN